MSSKYTITELIKFISKIEFENNFDNIENEIKRKEIIDKLLIYIALREVILGKEENLNE